MAGVHAQATRRRPPAAVRAQRRTMISGLLLVLCGLGGYGLSASGSRTPLIPAILGLTVLSALRLSALPRWQLLAPQFGAAIAACGVLLSHRGWRAFLTSLVHGELPHSLIVQAQGATAALCLLALLGFFRLWREKVLELAAWRRGAAASGAGRSR